MVDEVRLRRLKWRSRRGMLELDYILENFIKHGIEKLSEPELQTFELLLETPDPELYAWLMEQLEPTNMEFMEIVKLIRASYSNK